MFIVWFAPSVWATEIFIFGCCSNRFPRIFFVKPWIKYVLSNLFGVAWNVSCRLSQFSLVWPFFSGLRSYHWNSKWYKYVEQEREKTHRKIDVGVWNERCKEQMEKKEREKIFERTTRICNEIGNCEKELFAIVSWAHFFFLRSMSQCMRKQCQMVLVTDLDCYTKI